MNAILNSSIERFSQVKLIFMAIQNFASNKGIFTKNV